MKTLRRLLFALLLAGLAAGCEISMDSSDDASTTTEPDEPTTGSNIIIYAETPVP